VYKPKSAIVHKINSRIPELITFMRNNIRIECQLLNRAKKRI
jgi:lantibiotic modifying enzyme